ncbi:hypothetical protein ABBQ32_003167 [Trebouxia sp. C0010 RCD-2024]
MSAPISCRIVTKQVFAHGTTRCHTFNRSPAKCRFTACSSSRPLTEKRCEPCEPTTGSLDYMGLCMALSKDEAEALLSQGEVDGWELREDEKRRLHMRRHWRTKNFVKALELCKRFGGIAEQENHHPDLHITGWNQVLVEVWTHARDGLTENDFILAAKLNKLPKEDLLRKPKKKLTDSY